MRQPIKKEKPDVKGQQAIGLEAKLSTHQRGYGILLSPRVKN